MSLNLSAHFTKLTDEMLKRLAKEQKNCAELLCENIKADAPVDTGLYRGTIYATDPVITKDGVETKVTSDYYVTAMNGKSYQMAALLEYGTLPHSIDPVNCEYLHFIAKDGTEVYTKHVDHPGTIAQPHWKPAVWKFQLYYKVSMHLAARGK